VQRPLQSHRHHAADHAPILDQELAQSEFMMGLAFAIAKSTNVDRDLHVQGMPAELIQ
jgi:hypothetical protein